ncbi:MAG: beta-ketoacyl synthase chain length factor [Candidatus Omnitrophica bacterium]|nr:beta-ketoacyl synthase chain length factor [Candidatus Omnitrophota bacterium]
MENLKKSLEEGWKMPDPVYRVPAESIVDKSVLKEARRIDNLSKMAVLAAHDAFIDSGLGNEVKNSLGIILATAFGPHVTTFRFLDDILNYGDAQVSPTIFSHSVHNAAVSYIASALQSRGPTLTITQFAHSFHQAMMLAESWLNEDRCEHVLVGSVDQCGKVMEYICSQKLSLAQDGRIKPFLFSSDPETVPGEGSAFFLVSAKKTSKRYCSVSTRAADDPKKPDMYLVDCDGMAGSEEAYRAIGETGSVISSCTPIFGSMLTVSSFNCVAAALMLKEQRYYAAPIQDNPHGLNLCKEHQPAKINSINCVRYGCKRKKLEIYLTNE